MTQIFASLVSFLVFASAAHACNCGDGAKTSFLKNVTSREASVITSRDGTPLKTNFWGVEDASTEVVTTDKESNATSSKAAAQKPSELKAASTTQKSVVR